MGSGGRGWAPERVEGLGWRRRRTHGWQLVRADRLLLRFQFERTESRNVRVVADFPVDPSEGYMTLFRDAGWEPVGKGGGWRLWRKEYTGANRPEAFTDLDSLIDRNSRLLVIMLAGFVGGLYLTLDNPLFQLFRSPLGTVAGVILAAFTVFLALGAVALGRTLRNLKAKRDLSSS